MTHSRPFRKKTPRNRASRPAAILVASLVAATVMPARPACGQREAPRFDARFSDGTRLYRQRLAAWHDANATPRLGRHPLFDSDNPTTWLVRDRPGPIGTPRAFVEFVGGDRLSGVVVGAASPSGTIQEAAPRHLLVEASAALRRPNLDNAPPFRVTARHVRRVVWTRRETAVPPATAVRRDGSRVDFRAVRWSNDAVALLTENEIVSIPYDELAEVRLPRGEPWQAYLDHAAALLPQGTGRLIQLETDSGLTALTSTARLRPITYGDNRYCEHWYQVIQPAWSLDPLWVRFPDIRLWRFFPPERPPLTLFDPRVRRKGVFLSHAMPPTTNMTRAGHPLTDSAGLIGWGFATHAPCEMTVPVPPLAIALESDFGLDPAVDAGGCARARIELRQRDKTSVLFESETLIGTGPSRSTGRLPISEAARGPENTLCLIADPHVDERPPGADPFDIRDSLNWYAPTLALDPKRTRQELRRRAIRQALPPSASDLVGESVPFTQVTTAWSTRDWDDPRFRTSVSVRGGYLGFRQELAVPADARYLAVLAYSPKSKESAPARLLARVDGSPIVEREVPAISGRRAPEPLLFPIGHFAGKTATIELFQLPSADASEPTAPVEWIAVAPVARRPGLHNLLANPPPGLNGDPKDGTTAVAPPGFDAPRVAGWDFSITEEPEIGEYRYVQWCWNRSPEEPIALAFAHDGVIGTDEESYVPPPRIRQQPSRSEDRGARNGFRYIVGDADSEDPRYSPAIALDESPSQHPVTVRRDLFRDFGAFQLTGLAIATEQTPVAISGLWLARSPELFTAIDGEPAEFGPRLERVAAGFSFWSPTAEVALLDRYAGRNNVLRAEFPESQDNSLGQLTAITSVPEDGDARLRGAFAWNLKGDKAGTLRVAANGETIHEIDLPANQSAADWTELDESLSEYADQTIRLTLTITKPNTSRCEAYWHEIHVAHDNLKIENRTPR